MTPSSPLRKQPEPDAGASGYVGKYPASSDAGSTAPASGSKGPAKTALEDLSQWQLIRRRFARHRMAAVSLLVLVVVYAIALMAEVAAPYPAMSKNLDYAYCPPQPPRFSFGGGLHVYAVESVIDPITFRRMYVEHAEDVVPLKFFARGEPYKLWGLIPWDRHLLGVDLEHYRPQSVVPTGESARPIVPTFYLLGGDKYGRDIFSRIVYGSRISLSIGLVSIVIMFFLGVTIGGVSGYLGGAIDNLIQRGIEILNAFPRLPLWLALAAVFPPDWSPLRVYFAITIVLSLLGWTGLARVVRGKLLSLREEDYAVAARLLGAGHSRIIFRHLLPGFTSHIIVALTMSVPGMILGETALSFLGLGLRPPIVSWGVMLQDAMNMQTVANYPWLLAPVVFIIVTVLCFNFAGDGMRDAADPYASR
ncbi:MAG: ABC transporter permease [Planctomycetes bacterium]|nr:ABC transporter permease [Planctomycetota bacterium]